MRSLESGLRSKDSWVRSEGGRWKSTHRGNSLVAYPTCAMVRTEELPPKVAEVQGRRLRGDPSYLTSERIGNKSMMGKREMPEDVYGMVPQRLRDMVRAGLSEPQ